MEDALFQSADKAIQAAGSKDPREVAEYFGILVVDLKGSIAGYAAHYAAVPAIGLNVRLDTLWYRFGGWHELAHVFSGDIYRPGFQGGHGDGGFFTQEVDCRAIPRHELRANLVSANVNIEDDAVFALTNYHSPVMREYRNTKANLEKLSQSYKQLCLSMEDVSSALLKTRTQELRREIRSVRETLREMEEELASVNCGRTFGEMASVLGVPERLFRYKLEAMRLRGFEIDPQELERYNKVFKDVL